MEYKFVREKHPILSGIEPFAVIDETYIMGEPEIGLNEILIQTENPNSIKSLRGRTALKTAGYFALPPDMIKILSAM